MEIGMVERLCSKARCSKSIAGLAFGLPRCFNADWGEARPGSLFQDA